MPALRSPAFARLTRALLALLLAATATVAIAQERGGSPKGPPTAEQKGEQRSIPGVPGAGVSGAGVSGAGVSGAGVLRLLPPDSVTQHTIETPSGKIDYTATAGTLNLFDQSGERIAAIFYTAYVAKGADMAKRPLTFAFNGGPGAASAYLHLGLVGPRIAEFGISGREAAATRLRDNPHTWLAFTDLVLIDPVGSGWSKPVKADGGSAFWGVRRDAETMAKTVALYISKSGRGSSPRYLLGESYGGFRAAKVARALYHDQGLGVSGIVMVSPLLEGGLTFMGSRFPLGAALQLPSLAAAELDRKGTLTPQTLAEAEKFAMTEYLSTLAGRPPQGEAARLFYARVAEVSGLPVDVVTRARGFIRDTYVKHLREGKVVSSYDATFAVPDPYPEQESSRGPDPILDGITRAYGGAFANYARDELGFKTEMTYVLLSSEAGGKWEWDGGLGRAGAGVSDDLRAQLSIEPAFRLMIAHGYSDMVTPYAASRYVLDHLPQMGDPARTQLKLYRGGHMFYLDANSRRAFTADARAFYQEP
jgi:carboxypeptidase C (cathepsin A)